MTYYENLNQTLCDSCGETLEVGSTITVCDESGFFKRSACDGHHLCNDQCWVDHVKEFHTDRTSVVLRKEGEIKYRQVREL